MLCSSTVTIRRVSFTGLKDDFLVDGLDGVDVDNANRNSVNFLSSLGGVYGLQNAYAAGDNGNIGAVFNKLALADSLKSKLWSLWKGGSSRGHTRM